jgi:hypothetical protein
MVEGIEIGFLYFFGFFWRGGGGINNFFVVYQTCA